MGLAWGWACAAGACAATSAIMAKLASPLERWDFKVACYAIVVLCNVSMWSLYVRSLTALSSLQATVVNFGSNFLLSGLAGFLIFSEPAHFEWFAGAGFILAGIWVISNAGEELQAKKMD
ncbi:hypothetical protein MPTK1_3g23850 [Marchantia polymorpha subsp. ruderalis]|uniref:EamA domain-containing protein n=2 Tax=Marchantia polymorpha TaxID=3197 RepID=A0A176W9K2_MARPO|nr:hypothetical protein AXG93_4831s1230 [Marchantia polymorpha subsp. ruderalis]PTQ30691.1 hypothetical protein MARPO_0121s0038 [Marchantia polymorpha]PTQ30692.1 hypothetical protein MARPO_0121s0038 [Marchantia polymorpha]PTQ30693.1 hypothetical protein MARPO_0121s0038 [Marchantia polymorpha]PTQ30694.1 hypothetical protein MARPO_0121s0038 [Marchantia polymorpha]|eukprot:PTQ30691.1 hypothetical protein MARPO_0121s0038 [Marchantia polymorpha]